MKTLPWVVAGVSLGVAVYVLINPPSTWNARPANAADDAAAQTGAWGTKQRITGTGGNLLGKVKEGVGRATGDDDLAGEGLVDQAVGAVKDTAGQAAHAVSDTIDQLNK